MIQQGKVAVYFHLNPVTKVPFYVGIGVKLRPYRKSGRSVLWNRYVKKYGIEVVIVHLFDTWESAQEKEKEYIKQYGRIGNRTGILVNHTDGGDGTLGCTWNIGSTRTAEQRKKISDALKGRKPSKQCVEASLLVIRAGIKRKHPMTEDAKRKISESKKGISLSEDTRRKISQALKGRVFSEETKIKNSEANKGRLKTDAQKKKISESVKIQWAEKRTWFYK